MMLHGWKVGDMFYQLGHSNKRMLYRITRKHGLRFEVKSMLDGWTMTFYPDEMNRYNDVKLTEAEVFQYELES